MCEYRRQINVNVGNISTLPPPKQEMHAMAYRPQHQQFEYSLMTLEFFHGL